MFTITSSRIVGLIAVVCAVIVAPQALAMPSTDTQDATPTIIAPPDAEEGYDLSGLDLSDLNNIPGYQQQQEYLKGLALPALAGGTPKSVTSATFVYQPTNPGWGAAATAAKKSAAKPASEPVVKTAPVVCMLQIEYDYVYSGCEWWS